MSRKTYYQTGRQIMRSHARQYKDLEDNTAKIADACLMILTFSKSAVMRSALTWLVRFTLRSTELWAI